MDPDDRRRSAAVGCGESGCGAALVVQRWRHRRDRGDAAQPIRPAAGTADRARPRRRRPSAEGGRDTAGAAGDAPGPSAVAEAAARTLAAASSGSRDAARQSGAVRGLRPETNRDAAGVSRTAAPGSQGHVRRRGARRRRGPHRAAVRRTGRDSCSTGCCKPSDWIGSSVYIANVVPWRPPGNRTPTPQETQACLPFIRRQIELAAPEILVCLGGSAAQTLLGVRDWDHARRAGNWFDYEREDGRVIRAIAMLHPAYLLRQPASKRQAWADMRALAPRPQELTPEQPVGRSCPKARSS